MKVLLSSRVPAFVCNLSQSDGQTSIQNVRGYQRRIGMGAWYALPKASGEPVTEQFVSHVRAILSAASASPDLRKWVGATFVVKRVPMNRVPPKPFQVLIQYSPLLREAMNWKEKWEGVSDAEFGKPAVETPSPSASPNATPLQQRSGQNGSGATPPQQRKRSSITRDIVRRPSLRRPSVGGAHHASLARRPSTTEGSRHGPGGAASAVSTKGALESSSNGHGLAGVASASPKDPSGTPPTAAIPADTTTCGVDSAGALLPNLHAHAPSNSPMSNVPSDRPNAQEGPSACGQGDTTAANARESGLALPTYAGASADASRDAVLPKAATAGAATVGGESNSLVENSKDTFTTTNTSSTVNTASSSSSQGLDEGAPPSGSPVTAPAFNALGGPDSGLQLLPHARERAASSDLSAQTAAHATAKRPSAGDGPNISVANNRNCSPAAVRPGGGERRRDRRPSMSVTSMFNRTASNLDESAGKGTDCGAGGFRRPGLGLPKVRRASFTSGVMDGVSRDGVRKESANGLGGNASLTQSLADVARRKGQKMGLFQFSFKIAGREYEIATQGPMIAPTAESYVKDLNMHGLDIGATPAPCASQVRLRPCHTLHVPS